jgi:hypothetical protein
MPPRGEIEQVAVQSGIPLPALFRVKRASCLTDTLAEIAFTELPAGFDIHGG